MFNLVNPFVYMYSILSPRKAVMVLRPNSYFSPVSLLFVFKFRGWLDVTVMTVIHQLRCHIIWITQDHFLVFVCVLLMRGK